MSNNVISDIVEQRIDKTVNLSPEMQDFLTSKLGLSIEDIQNIQKDGEFENTLSNLIQNPENQTERMVFLGKYIYDGIIAEAQKQGKDPVDYALELKSAGQMTFSQQREFNKYYGQKAVIAKRDEGKGLDQAVIIEDQKNNEKRQAVIAKRDEGKGLDQAVIENENTKQEIQERLEQNEKDVKQYTSLAKGELNPEGSNILATEVDTAKKDEKFIKTLEEKGYKKEDIVSGKFDDTLTGYILAEREQEFIARGYIRDVDTFRSAITNTRDVLGIPKILDKSFDDNLPIAKGPRRDQIVSEGTKLVESGKYNEKNIIYNSETGRIRFEPKNINASIVEIDTSRIPPRLEYIKNGLRIGRDIETISPEEQKRKEKEKILAVRQGETQKAQKDYMALLGSESYKRTDTELGKDTDIQLLIEQKKILLTEYSEATDISNKKEIIGRIQSILTQTKKTWKESIGPEDILNNAQEFNLIDTTLEQEDATLKKLQQSLSSEEQAQHDLPPGVPTKNQDTTFESMSEYTLNSLVAMGYDKLGQDNIELLMRGLREKHQNQGIWKDATIDTDDRNVREQQLIELRQVAETLRRQAGKTYKETFTDIQNAIRGNEAFRNVWKSPRGLSIWLKKQQAPESVKSAT